MQYSHLSVEQQANLEAIRNLIQSATSPHAAMQAAMEAIKGMRSDYYWVGVYLLQGDELVVGPYAGPTTEHTRIPIGRGVCGSAVAENRNIIVDDVSQRDNYLACNLLTKSEIVVLIRDENDRILGQIDVDCTTLAGVKGDEPWLQAVADLLAPSLAATQ